MYHAFQPASFFGPQPNDRAGNATRHNPKARSRGNFNENFSMAKSFAITESVKMDFRWEIYDIFNLKTWSNPSSRDLANSQFGIVTGASGNRTMQMGLKFLF